MVGGGDEGQGQSEGEAPDEEQEGKGEVEGSDCKEEGAEGEAKGLGGQEVAMRQGVVEDPEGEEE